MFKWMRRRRAGDEPAAVAQSREDDRDTGEDAYESEEEIAREIAPSGETRVKTDGI
jgi:hypothetical protein